LLFLFSIRFIIILFSSFNIDGKKKRKVDDECRAFNEEWGVKYFFLQSNSKDKGSGLIWLLAGISGAPWRTL
jgi:hypothetical protein